MINKEDPMKNLSLYQKGYLKLCGLYFFYIIYTDQRMEELKMTLMEKVNRVTVIHLKKLSVTDFQEEVEIDDLIDYVKMNLTENAEAILLDP